MPIFRTKNENFFKKWSPEMAYILGFFAADGSMVKNKRGAHFIEFEITDEDLLEKIRRLLNSNHKITTRKRLDKWGIAYRLQIGSKIIFNDLLKLGLNPHKSKRLELPHVPQEYFSHFLRGYFDGDGNVTICTYKRKVRKSVFSTILQSGFTSGSKKFLENIQGKLLKLKIVRGGTLYYSSGGWRLYFSINDSRRLYWYMYGGLSQNNKLFLGRKKKIFQEYFKID